MEKQLCGLTTKLWELMRREKSFSPGAINIPSAGFSGSGTGQEKKETS